MKSESKLPPETEKTFHTFAKEMYESAGLLQGKKHHTCSYLYNLATEGYIKAIMLCLKPSLSEDKDFRKHLDKIFKSYEGISQDDRFNKSEIELEIKDLPEYSEISYRYRVQEALWDNEAKAQEFLELAKYYKNIYIKIKK